VLLHGYPQGKPTALLSAAGVTAAELEEDRLRELLYVATQVAVWHFSDGAALAGNPAGQKAFSADEFAVVQGVYSYLTTGEDTAPEPEAGLAIDPASAKGAVGGKAGPFTVTGPSGEITLTVQGWQAVDAAGRPITTIADNGKLFLVRDTPGDVTVTAFAQSTHTTGRVFLYRGGHGGYGQHDQRQKLILAGTVNAKMSATATAAFAAPGSHPSPKPSAGVTASPGPSGGVDGGPTPTPTASASSPAPAGGTGGGSLPLTGASTMAALGAGVLLLVGGAVAVLLVRRRRVSFTA
jgi:TQXA domain-containing protein/LPXTG-motif cell wall-anchored protein